jgi:hypothetical protein
MRQGLRFEFGLHQEPVLPLLKSIKQHAFAHSAAVYMEHSFPMPSQFCPFQPMSIVIWLIRTRRFLAIGQNLTANQQTRL